MPAAAPTTDQGTVVIAIYAYVYLVLYSIASVDISDSYEAAEDNEISFAEGDKIIHVDTEVSDDWWEGTTASGATGLFPGRWHFIIVLHKATKPFSFHVS